MSIDALSPSMESETYNFEKVSQGVEVARGVFNQLAGRIEADLKGNTMLQWDERIDATRLLSLRRSGQQKVDQDTVSLALAELLSHPLFANQDNAVLNFQPPKIQQDPHEDDGFRAPVYVVQFSDDGRFGYLDTTTGSYKELEVGQGDVVLLTDPYLRHYGRNPSEHDRYNVVIANNSTQATFGEE